MRKNTVKLTLKTVFAAWQGCCIPSRPRKNLEILIEDVRPDLIYVLHYQNKISASIFNAAVK
jgi:hypothetical protein